jgi:hypothetical protein
MRTLLLLSCMLFASLVQAQKTTVLICISKTAHAYHKSMCRGLDRCTHSIKELTELEAKRLGKDPCDFCYPGGIASPVSNIPNVVASIQCSAITQKGTRCSRKVRSGSFCFQHGG